jgi:hypothetical protein
MPEFVPQQYLSTNYVPNGSFETGTTGWVGTRATLSHNTSVSRFGGASARLDITDASQVQYLASNAAAQYRFPVTYGENYYVGASVQCPIDWTFRIQVYEYDNTGTLSTPVWTSETDLTEGESWHALSYEYTPVYATTVSIRIIVTTAATLPLASYFYVDGVHLGGADYFFDGDSLDVYGDTIEEHRTYAWTGAPYESTSEEFNGGFWFEAPPDTPPKLTPFEPPPVKEDFANSFLIEVSSGDEWINVSDGLNFEISATEFGTKTLSRRRIQASSPFFDGTYLLHSTEENITEPLTIIVYGETQNDVTENILLLQQLFSQFRYKVRVRYGNHRETWNCEPADYSLERTHTYLHNNMAMIRFQIPRLPKMTQEVIM